MFTSNLSASGSTATVAALVCMRPLLSVTGTRWTRCTPDSYFSTPYTPSPLTAKSISLNPPTAPSLTLVMARFQPFDSQNFLYMAKRSPAKRQASSPPVPARISISTFFASSGSFGTRAIFISSSIFGCSSSLTDSSSRAISFISGSLSLASMSFASAMALRQAM